MLKTKKNIALAIVTLFLIFITLIWFCTAEKIDLNDYTAYAAWQELTAEQVDTAQTILQCSVTGDTRITQNLSANEFDEVLDSLGLYFGSCFAHWNVALWRPGYAEVNLELLKTLEQDKVVLDTKIDNILSKMYEGSDRFKLWQISNYLAITITYSVDIDDVEPLSGLSGKGSCMTYSMLFYKMATRLGIETYTCYGDVQSGMRTAPHAWNVVVLNNRQYFYDITWYDTVLRFPWYLHSKTSWNRTVTVFHLLSDADNKKLYLHYIANINLCLTK